MIGAFSLGFTEPLVLTGLITLPVLWWLLRLVPPRPRRIDFPPTRLLLAIAPKEETPARTPWWLTLLRLALAALIIVAAAGPLWHPPAAGTKTRAPLAILIDDGWTAASTWDARLRTADDVIMRAADDRRAVALLPLSQGPRDVSLETAESARVRLHQIEPVPYRIDRAEALPSLSRFLSTNPKIELVWLSDGIDLGNGASFVNSLQQTIGEHPLTIVTGGVAQPCALNAAENAAGALTVKVLRATPGANDAGTVRALDLKGLALGEAQFNFNATEHETEARFELPVELRNEIARLEIAGQRSAGAVQLLDKRSRRRTVGIVSGANADVSEPLLSSSYYLQRALEPFADVRLAQGESPADAVTHFLDQNLPMLILTDVGNVGDAHDRLARWVEDGGVLVRFAGPRLAASEDDLVPVRLRRGGRILGGSLSWDTPQPLAALSRDSPFGGIPVPNDVTVTRQVLAEPDATLGDNTWATLADGTPLVTAAHRGRGLIVLFHVTGDTRWSDLPLSGTFVEMLKRVVALSGTNMIAESGATKGKNARTVAAPSHILDGFGSFIAPPPTARPVAEDFVGSATPDHPPGFYGPPDSLVAVNTLTGGDRLAALDFAPLVNASREVYRTTEPQDLRGPVLLAAIALLLLDSLIVLFLGGGIQRLIPRRAPAAPASILILALVTLTLASTHAQQAAGTEVPQSALETKLAYVITGNSEVDAISKAGLAGLTLFLAQRTALEPGDPIGLDIARDELVFYPLIYWPIVPGAPRPSDAALKRIDTYMKDGGTVLFDTRDAVVAPPGQGGETRSPGMLELRKILSSLDIPELEPVPRDHVLTKTFYLLRDFPGRFDAGQLWVEALPSESQQEASGRPARGGDGVSSIIITSNDFAGAWATRQDGQPLLPMVDGQPRQRELAFRAGVNIVMYTLTGNYKADQVHVPALLERLGQ
ncbi:MAG TPA: DUF4159 domain-containing protein [Xanthobacteraceae bacterium]|nr:DUF4159 domain-containing protein [Xanthobacteraceae bacterium]HYQ06146.1 DUF4159 domain-containing protein [Xanthobacteraceae bacterium]